MAYRPICLWSFFVLLLHPVACDVYYEQEGKDITMPCTTKENSNEIKWLFESDNIFILQKSGFRRKGNARMTSRSLPGSFSTGSIQIKKLQRSDTGKYECHSSGSKTEHHLYVVTVSASPPGPLLHSSKVTLTCSVEGKIQKKTIWKKPSGIKLDTEDSTVILSYVTFNDTGTWSCQIKDDAMKHEHQLNINVLGLNKDTDTVLSVQEGASVILPCILSSSVSYPPFNTLQLNRTEWRDHKGKTLLFAKDKGKNNKMSWEKGEKDVPVVFTDAELNTNFSLVLNNVKVHQSGNYTCSVVFSNSLSLEVKVALQVSNQMAGNKVLPGSDGNQSTVKLVLHQNLWLWVAVGVGFIILISLIIVVVVLHQRKKRIKRMKKMKSMKQCLAARKYCTCNRVVNHPNGNESERT